MRVIIPCGGNGKRWGNHTGVPKQLVTVNEEFILQRTIRLCKQFGTNDIWVITEDPKIKNICPSYVRLSQGIKYSYPVYIDKIMCSRKLWTIISPTVILFGDTYFTEEAIQTIICKEKEIITFYGRFHTSKLTRKDCPEIYALKFNPSDHSLLNDHCEKVRQAIINGQPKRKIDYIKSVLSSIHNQSFDYTGCETSKYFHTIDDWTEDFDKPIDLINWQRGRKKYKLSI